MTTITYIAIDETHRIEVMPSGNHYPQYLAQPELKEYSEGWSYWKIGNKQKSFKTERAARKFLAQQVIAGEPTTLDGEPSTSLYDYYVEDCA